MSNPNGSQQPIRRGQPFGDDNPPPRRGRRKGARGRWSIITEIANETHKIVVDGKIRRVRTLELVLRALDEAARKGNQRALRECDRLLERYGPRDQQGCYLVVPATTPVDTFKKIIELHNTRVVQPDPNEA
ncbi:DUF5681 domain-containing protein [Erythrobacter sp. Alg231-14]|uniref:DUF5681 domain-containing protein n=1 Tax=Erythrobacter sp. Alg231-14 TaxID=1922225 RepID=UPI000D5587AE